jgi:hypothetical protein
MLKDNANYVTATLEITLFLNLHNIFNTASLLFKSSPHTGAEPLP